MPPVLSIIIPHYNHKLQLPRTLDSILNQTLQDIEVIIVDDKSDISCIDIIHAYRNKGMNIVFVENTERKYTKESRLIGIENSNGELITFLDADDAFYKNKALGYHVRQQMNTGVDILHFNTHYTENGIIMNKCPYWLAPLAESLDGKDIFKKYVLMNCGGHTLWGKIVRRELWLRCLPFARACSVRRYCEDLFLSSLLFFWARSYRGSSRIGYLYERQGTQPQKAFGRAATHYSMIMEFLPYIERHGVDAATYAALRKYFFEKFQQYFHEYIQVVSEATHINRALPETLFEKIWEHAEPDKAVRIIMTGLILLSRNNFS